ncbi:hypothetical protein [Bacillus amyloliquefaciens]|uniref:hypothetical protein n=1 Tax=Bacillus amyloliquefaciens TaxID=1390 RepID=UPI0008268176|nr:hypothetical protein [Bacillus amyloliquefaciens]AOC91178.1 hypothetical protein BARD7_01708 [Bacillus amyloliquefaciens]
MKKLISTLLVAFGLLCLGGSFSFTPAASAVEFSDFKEYYSIDNLPVYMPSRYADVSISNSSKEDTNFRFQIFERGTKKVLFEKSGFLAAGSEQTYKWYLDSSYQTNRPITDMKMYRDNENASPTFLVKGK